MSDVVDGAVSRGSLTQEQGASGLKGATPREGWLYEEFLPQLRGLAGARVYRAMADNDPIIGAALFAFKMLLRNVKWTVASATPGDTAADAAKEWLEGALFQDMLIPFNDVLSDVLSFLQYGFAPVEVVYKLRSGAKRDPRQSSAFTDGKLGIAKLAVRSQDTIYRWFFDEFGELMGFEQYLMGRANATISRDKMLLFRTENTLGNPEGRSLLRNAYISYLRKNTIEEAEGRAAIRSAGIVRMRIPGKYLEASAGSQEAAIASAYKVIADKLAQDRMGSVLLPSDVDQTTKVPLFDLDYVIADGRRPTDMTTIIERQDKRMLSSVLADFILLGQQSVGSFALSDSKTDLFAKACGAFLSMIQDQFNRVLITRLWTLNAFDLKTQPKLNPGDLQSVDLDKLSNFILRMAQAGAQFFPDPALEAELRTIAGLPASVEQG